MFRIRVKGESDLYGALERLAKRVSDFRQRWGRNIEIRHRYQREWMDTRGRGSWPKLTDAYLESKSRDPKAGFLEILQLTGHLYRSLTETKAADSVVEEGRTRLTMGTSDFKARLHHEGRGRLPVRQVISIENDERREHAEVLYESIAEAARSEGFKVVS
jgi:hypothetical protein